MLLQFDSKALTCRRQYEFLHVVVLLLLKPSDPCLISIRIREPGRVEYLEEMKAKVMKKFMLAGTQKPHIYLGILLIIVGVASVTIAVRNLDRIFSQTETVFDMTAELDELEDGFLPAVDRLPETGEAQVPQAPELEGRSLQLLFSIDPEGNRIVVPLSGSVQVNSETVSDELEWIPERLIIPGIELDTTIIAAGMRELEYEGALYQQWTAPNEFAVGWHSTSATLGLIGNTVLNGHHNVYGEVFRDLEHLDVGDLIEVYSGGRVFLYEVVVRVILKERWQPLEVRMENARWLQSSADERLTLVTCWPYESNTHRLVLAAFPLGWVQADSADFSDWSSGQ